MNIFKNVILRFIGLILGIENEQNFIAGDKITVYGEGAGTGNVYDNNGYLRKSTCVNMAYVILQDK